MNTKPYAHNDKYTIIDKKTIVLFLFYSPFLFGFILQGRP
jgi:hypothetical protein